MQRNKIQLFLIMLLLIGPFVLFSCASNPNVSGKWINTENKGTIEFRGDGTFSGVDNMGAAFKGNYTVNNGNIELEVTHTDIMRETMQPEISSEIVKARISVKENELQLFISDQKGNLEIEKYQRDK